MNTKNLLPFLIFALIVVVISCNDENPVPKPAPDIPLKSSMLMDFEDFSEQDTSGGKGLLTYQHWGRAAAHLLVWNTAITITLAIPVKSFQEAFNHEAIYDPDTETWTWSYNFWAGGALYLAELQASLITEGVAWKMYITKNNHFTDFLWYSGVSNLDNSSGHWELKHHPEDPSDFLYIEWNRDPLSQSGDIKYTNIIPDGENYGSYIFYGTSGEPGQAYYDIFGALHENLVNIEWDRTDKNGRIKDELFFSDQDWHCWDTNLEDTVCE